MWSHLIVPQWHNADNWLVHSNRIGRPQRMPSQDPAWLAAWWIKPEAQAGTAQPGKAKAP
jgi:ABC-type oligopeptide transport system substrate-binding subunit